MYILCLINPFAANVIYIWHGLKIDFTLENVSQNQCFRRITQSEPILKGYSAWYIVSRPWYMLQLGFHVQFLLTIVIVWYGLVGVIRESANLVGGGPGYVIFITTRVTVSAPVCQWISLFVLQWCVLFQSNHLCTNISNSRYKLLRFLDAYIIQILLLN